MKGVSVVKLDLETAAASRGDQTPIAKRRKHYLEQLQNSYLSRISLPHISMSNVSKLHSANTMFLVEQSANFYDDTDKAHIHFASGVFR